MTDRAADGVGDAAAPRTRGLAMGWKVVIGLLALVLVAGGAYVAVLAANWGSVEKVETQEVLPDYEGRPEPAPESDGGRPLNILLLGSDSRDPGSSLVDAVGSRSDTIMVANISGDRKTVTVVSIMRDSWVEIPGFGMSKINAAYAYGGVPLVARTLEQLIGARIDHVAIVDFEGFKGITEALGGVTLKNDVEFSPSAGSPTPDAHFASGTITITDGDLALSYVRERKAFADGDYQRVRNQQAFLRGVIDGILSKETLANPVRVQQLAQALGGYVATDSALDLGTTLSLATSLSGLRSSDIRMFTLPTLGTGMEGSQSVVYLDSAQVEVLKQAWSSDGLAGYEPPKP